MFKMKTQVSVLVYVLSVSFVASYSSGPPPTVCESMEPNHMRKKQMESGPYYFIKIVPTADLNIKNVTIKAEPKYNMKGLFVQARLCSGSNALNAKFTINKNLKYISCNKHTNNTIGHQNPKELGEVNFLWDVSSIDKKNEVYLRATIVQKFTRFWIIKSTTLGGKSCKTRQQQQQQQQQQNPRTETTTQM